MVSFKLVSYKGGHYERLAEPSSRKTLVITSKNIKFGTLHLNNVNYIIDFEHDKFFKRCDVRFGDILLTKDGANAGNATLNTIPFFSK